MNKIGKEVWLFNHNTIPTIETENKSLIVGIVEQNHTLPDGSINNDYCNHLILQKEDGTIFHEREDYVVFCPNKKKKGADQIYNYLKDNEIYADVYINSEKSVEVSISWGDWKHEHGWCDVLMSCIGYSCDDVIVTEDDGSDCYSAEHYYSKVE